MCDWNSDGRLGFLLGEMVTFPVGDHGKGRVTLWLGDDDHRFERLVLAEPMARVVSAVPLDYDEDGDLDVIVAEFDWRKTGSLKLLRNRGGSAKMLDMAVEVIDPHHGAWGVELGIFAECYFARSEPGSAPADVRSKSMSFEPALTVAFSSLLA